jgi:hypothetical protein
MALFADSLDRRFAVSTHRRQTRVIGEILADLRNHRHAALAEGSGRVNLGSRRRRPGHPSLRSSSFVIICRSWLSNSTTLCSYSLTQLLIL